MMMMTLMQNGADAASASAGELGVLAALVTAGVMLLLLGRRLVKTACVASGVVLGLSAAWLGAQMLAELQSYLWVALAAGALAGGLLAAALFRFWVAAASGVVLALVVPAATLAWQGSDFPVGAGGDGVEAGELAEGEGDERGGGGLPVDSLAGIDTERVEEKAREAVEQAKAAAGELGDSVLESVKDVLGRQRNEAEAWWSDLGERGRRSVAVGAGVGGVLGVLLGIAAPYTASSLLSAMAGALLVVFAGRTLAVALGGESVAGLAPDGPRGLVLLVGLITVAGIAVQWMLRPRKDD